MKCEEFTKGQSTFPLWQAQGGTPVPDVWRQLGVSESVLDEWGKNQFAHLGRSELHRIRPLQDENKRLERLVADLTLDKHILSETLSQKDR
jgi:putative transposase